MPDFFLDRLVTVDCNLEDFSGMLGEVANRGGGSIDGVEQLEIRGGNAVNTASALSALEVKVTPIVCTTRLGLKLLRFYLNPENVDLSRVKICDRASMTTALEFEDEQGKVNVMVRDVGALADFGPHHLDQEDFQVIEDADYVCVFNWAGTRHFGTQLADTVFHHVKDKGRGKTYYDTADPTTNKAKIPELMEKVLQSKCIDVLSVNENEAICYASQLSREIEKSREASQEEELAKDSARILASHLSARVDLHTTGFSATFTDEEETVVPAFQVPMLRVTGAGDAWNAGNMWGDALGLSHRVRLALANLVAAYYISNPKGVHPTRKQLIRFCKKMSRNSD